MEFIKKNIFSILTSIPIIFLAVGAIVISNYLAEFGVIDFPVFNGRTVFVGFVALLQLLVFIILWYTFISCKGSIEELLFLIINPLWKTIVFSNIVFMLTLSKSNNLADFEFLGWIWYSKPLVSLSTFSFLGFFILLVGKEYIDNGIKNDKIGKIFFWVGLIFTLISIIPIILLLIKNEKYRGVFSTYGYMSLILFIQTFQIWAIRNDKSRGLNVEEYSLFSKDKKLNKMDYIFFIFWLLIVIIINLSNYSTNIFPNISTNLGGGKYKFSELLLEDGNIIRGKIIHTNGDYLYLYDDPVLKQISISKIIEYK